MGAAQSSFDFESLGEVEVAENEAIIPETALAWGGRYLKQNFFHRTGRFQECSGVSVGVARQRTHAAAKTSGSAQAGALVEILELVKKMTDLKQWRAIACVEHSRYDETPLIIRLKYVNTTSPAEKQFGKVFLIERSYTLLIEKLPTQFGTFVADVNRFFTLECFLSPALRGAENKTAETICEILKSATVFPRQFVTLFEQNIRLTETDEDKANMRCEAMWHDGLPSQWDRAHFLCLGHKTHAAATKSWLLQTDLVSYLIHTTKHISTSGANARLKAAVVMLAKKRFIREAHLRPPAEAEEFKRDIVNMFLPLPMKGSARRRATIQEVLEFFNADWRVTNVLRHYCKGPGCCPTDLYSFHRGVSLLTRLFTCLKPKVFNKDDWLHWDSSLAYFAFGSALHQLLPDAFQLAFNKDGAQVMAESRDAVDVLELIIEPVGGQGHAEPLPWEVPLDQGAMEVDDAMRKRIECARSLRAALAFMNHNMLHQIYLMRATLQPQQRLMHRLVHLVSGEWERRQYVALVQQGLRELRCNVFRKDDVPKFFKDSLAVFVSTDHFQGIPKTEDFRTRLFQLIWRAGSVIYQLVALPTQSFPFRLFDLCEVQPPDVELDVAKGILEVPMCLLDAWSRKLLSRFNTTDALRSLACKHTLTVVAERLQLTTYSTERLHSCNLRRAKARAMTHTADLPHLALQHMATSSPPWRPTPEQSKSKNNAKRGRGRPPKHADAHGKTKTKRGGGGTWRAFVLTRLGSQKFSAQIMRQLSVEYRALQPEERVRFSRLGRAGAVLSLCGLCKICIPGLVLWASALKTIESLTRDKAATCQNQSSSS